MLRNFLTLILLIISHAALTQSPKWIYRQPQSESGRFHYIMGQGASREDAYFDAVRALVLQRGNISVETLAKKEVEIKDNFRKAGFTNNTSVTVDNTNLFVFPVDQFFGDGQYYLLIGSPKAGSEIGGPIKTGQFVWRSVLVPGWGQFYNKQSKRGLLFSAGEVALAGGTLLAFSQAGNQQNKAELALRSGNISQYTVFNQSRNDWQTTGAILGIGAVAYWILNVVDATASDKNRYAMNKSDTRLQWAVTGNGIVLNWHL